MAIKVVEIAERGLSQLKGQGGLRERVMDNCYAVIRGLHQEYPLDRELRHQFVEVAIMTSNVKRFIGKYDAAMTIWKEAAIATENHLRDSPDDPQFSKTMIEIWREGVTLNKAVGDLVAAELAAKHARELLSKLPVSDSDDPDRTLLTAPLDLERIGLELDLGHEVLALSAAERCINAYKDLFSNANDDQQRIFADHRPVWLLAIARRGQVLQLANQSHVARDTLDAGMALAERFIDETPDTAGNLYYPLARLLNYSALAYVASGNYDVAFRQIENSIEIWKALEEASDAPGFRYYLGEALRVRGILEHQRDKTDQAMAGLDESRDVLELLAAEHAIPENFEALADTLHAIAKLEIDQEKLVDASVTLQEALSWQRKAVVGSPANVLFAARLSEIQTRYSEVSMGN